MKYGKIKTPKELLEFMNQNIKYGFVDFEGKIYTPNSDKNFQYACKRKWFLSSPNRLLDVKYGHCFDQVELERDWFCKHDYIYKTIYICFLLPYDNSYSIHSYLVFKEKDKWNYFEHSDLKNRGIYTFNTFEDVIEYQKEIHIENNRARNFVSEEELKYIYIYEYDKPTFNCSMTEFTQNILENGNEIKI